MSFQLISPPKDRRRDPTW